MLVLGADETTLAGPLPVPLPSMSIQQADSPSAGPRPRLLFLSQNLPYPLDVGAKIRTYHILRLLSGCFEVRALCFYRMESGLTQHAVDARVAALRAFGRLDAFPIPQEHSRARLAWDHLRSVLRQRSYTVYSYRSRAFRRALETALDETSFDLVYADSMDLSPYFPMLRGLPLVCSHQDATSVQLRRRGETEANRALGMYIRHQARLMERLEREWCARVTLNATVSEHDREVLSRLSPRGRFTVVPNGVDTEYFRPEPGGEHGIVCVGGLAWFPNRDALGFLAERILPLLAAAGEKTEVCWVGQADEAERAQFRQRHGIRVTGTVPDIRPYVRDAACYVVPLRVGGGTRVKILDAWAMGKAVVSTTVGCEGLEAVDGENILIRDDPQEFADAVRRVLGDPELRRRLGTAARRTVERRYGWEVIGERMLAEYLALIQPAAAPTGRRAATAAAPHTRWGGPDEAR
jgi:polysaccharide biosynthesis protein PslH